MDMVQLRKRQDNSFVFRDSYDNFSTNIDWLVGREVFGYRGLRAKNG